MAAGCRGCRAVVQATPVRDELLFAPRSGQTVIDLAYRVEGGETAHVAAARAAGCEVIDGIEVLVLQGAASFERWTRSRTRRGHARRDPLDPFS